MYALCSLLEKGISELNDSKKISLKTLEDLKMLETNINGVIDANYSTHFSRIKRQTSV